MNSARHTRQIALLVGGAALIGMSTLTACSTKEKEAPSTTSTPSTSQAPSTSEAPPMSTPTEKAIGPAGPSFSPTVNPVPPGAVCARVVNGVCSR